MAPGIGTGKGLILGKRGEAWQTDQQGLPNREDVNSRRLSLTIQNGVAMLPRQDIKKPPTIQATKEGLTSSYSLIAQE